MKTNILEEIILLFGYDNVDILQEIKNGISFQFGLLLMVLYGYFGFMVSNGFYMERDPSPTIDSDWE